MAELIRKQGGEPVSAPAMREVGCEENATAIAFGRDLLDGMVDIAVFFTGVGFRYLLQILDQAYPPAEIRDAIAKIITIARGPKPVAAMREQGLQPTVTVPPPNTWRETLVAMDAQLNVNGKRVAVLEYGEANAPFLAELQKRGAILSQVPVYRWALPTDLTPLLTAINDLLAGSIQVALFTSSAQVEHLLQVAKQQNQADVLIQTLNERVATFSIGPVCSETLRENGIDVDAEPQSPKMGSLILAASEHARTILKNKE